MQHLDQLHKEIKNNTAVLLDVREQNEWDMGHLKLASLVPLSDLQEGIIPNNLNKKAKTYIHCRSGQRVLIAQPLLEAEGFDNIIVLSEGFDELADYGFETD